MPDYIVKQGDCISSIAFEYGFFPKTIWNHPKNNALKKLRENPNILFTGDIVFIPEKEIKKVSFQTDFKKRFQRKGVPSKLSILLVDEYDKPMSNIQYELNIEGLVINGTTDSEGLLECFIAPSAKKGELIVKGKVQYKYSIEFGEVDPITEVTGIQCRLKDLGLYTGPVNGIKDKELEAAIRQFQYLNNLGANGIIDDLTKKKLVELFGS